MSAINLVTACLVLGIGDAPRPVAYQPRVGPVIAPSLNRAMANAKTPQRIWIFFTDKGLASSDHLKSRLAQRAMQLNPRTARRRQLRRTETGVVDERDLPIVGSYLNAVRSTGVTLRHESRWLNGVSADASPEQISQLAALPIVRLLQPVARQIPCEQIVERPVDEPLPRDNGAPWYSVAYNQLQQINIVAAHNAGYTGAGVVIGILDSGFNRTHLAFNQTSNGAHPVQVIAQHDFVANDGNTSQQPGDPMNQASHGTYVLGTLAAYYPNFLVGAAFDAHYLLAKTEDTSQEVPAEEDNYVAGIEWLEANGADMTTSSLGYLDWYTQADFDGQTAVTTIAVNTATDNGLVCCNAAGNEGHDTVIFQSHLIAPADAFKVITCGAVDSNGAIASFSSDGPTADGRVKPELLARGVAAATVTFSSNNNTTAVDGTSFSTPITAGGVSLILQAHPDWSVDKVRRALFQTADYFVQFGAYDFQFIRGYGISDIYGAIRFVHSDINGDGRCDGNDIPLFIDAVINGGGTLAQRRRADVDASGQADEKDIPIFVNDLLGF